MRMSLSLPAQLFDHQGEIVNGVSQVSDKAGFSANNYQEIMDNSVGRLFDDLKIKVSKSLRNNSKKYWAKIIVRDGGFAVVFAIVFNFLQIANKGLVEFHLNH